MEYRYFVLCFPTLIFANFMLPSTLAANDIIADTEDLGFGNKQTLNLDSAGTTMQAYYPDLYNGLDASLPDKNASKELQHGSDKNLIDKCWRGKADWADNRKALAECAMGFAKGTTGGAAGEIYTVTCNSDDNAENPTPGTLRYGAAQDKPLWIIFEKDMVITLKHTLVIHSDKTIDGRGANVEIANGGGLTIHNVNNVIIHNINVHDVIVTDGFKARSPCDGDALTIKTATKIWIDHCTLSKGPDGLLDVTVGSTSVTISNCRFHDHDKVVLLGADDAHQEDKIMRVTVAYNSFEETCTQRMPRCRFGFFQVVNNNYNKWKMYAIGGSSNPTILSQGNKFVASDSANTKQVLQRSDAQESEWKNWNWRSKDDLLENGAIFTASGTDPQLTPEQQEGMIEVAPASEVPNITKDAGVLKCSPGQPC